MHAGVIAKRFTWHLNLYITGPFLNMKKTELIGPLRCWSVCWQTFSQEHLDLTKYHNFYVNVQILTCLSYSRLVGNYMFVYIQSESSAIHCQNSVSQTCFCWMFRQCEGAVMLLRLVSLLENELKTYI